MSNNSHLDIAIASIKCFTDDGTLDVSELNFLLGLAMRDGVVDDNEKRVLNNIIGQVSRNEVTNATWNRIEAIKAEYNL